MKRLMLAAALVTALYGCASPQLRDAQDWVREQKPLAKEGVLKWSQYYEGLYNKISAVPSMKGKADLLVVTSDLLSAAQAYESGRISKEDFERAQRQGEIAALKMQEQADAQSRAAYAGALMNISNGYARQAQTYQTAPIPANAPTPAPPINCISRASGVTTTTTCQ